MKIALSIPGMEFISASTILAEIGDFRDFSSANKLAAYCGLVPSVYQSAGKLITGHITKHGSPHLRRIIMRYSNKEAFEAQEVLLEGQSKKRR